MERLTGLDASFLYNETPTLHMHTLKYAVLDVSTVPGGYSDALFRDELERRLHLLPPFRRRVVPVPGGLHHPVWIEDPAFDLAAHLRTVRVPPPGTSRQADNVIAAIASWPLDRRRPLWEIWVLEGLEGGRAGFLTKIHHTLADGVAAAQLLANVMTLHPDDPDPPPPDEHWRPEPVPSKRRLLADAASDLTPTLRRIPALVRRTAGGVRAVIRRRREADVSPPVPILHTPRTPFNVALTPHRSFASTTLSLEDVTQVRRAFDATVNDVILTVVGGAVRRYLDDRGELPARPLVAGVPVATPSPGDGDGPRLLGNRVSNMFTSLRTDIADPVERLAAVHGVMAAAKEVHGLLGPEMLGDWMEQTPPGPYSWAMRQYSQFRLADRHPPPINLVVSNVPGPREPLYVAGARMEGIWSVGPILEGIGLNVTVWSYLDRLHVGAIGCRETLPDIHTITDGMHSALAELVTAAG